MTEDLTAKIERFIEDHTLINGADECTCGVMWEIVDGFTSTDGSTCHDNHLAAAIADFLSRYLPPIVASAIHSYAQSEIVAIDYHGGQAGEREAMEKLHREAAQIANYATTHEKWSGSPPELTSAICPKTRVADDVLKTSKHHDEASDPND